MSKDDRRNFLIEALQKWAKLQPEKNAFTELFDDETVRKCISYKELEQEVAAYGYYLESRGVKYQENCLLIFEEVIEFVVAFFACIYVGAVPVPLVMPERGKDISFWKNIIENTDAAYILTSEMSVEILKELFPTGTILCREGTDKTLRGESRYNDLMSLQYTSGSTGAPKGVMVTQNELRANMDEIAKRLKYGQDTVIVSWLPYYHDLGMIVMLLLCVYRGSQAVVMMPPVFVRNPIRWMQAISEFRGTISGAPNFAYELISNALEQCNAALDLSSLKILFSGGEPVKINDIIRFNKMGERFFLQKGIIMFGYGQAEASLVVSVHQTEAEDVKWVRLDRQKMQAGKLEIIDSGYISGEYSYYDSDDSSMYLVDNGRCIDGHSVTIREIEGLEILPPNTIGEICFAGPCISKGYYKNTEKTKEILVSDTDGTTLLRMGDLGFVDEEGRVFITGRIKDLIIINGENYSPMDMENSVQAIHEGFCKNGGIVFAYQENATEKLVIVQELRRNADLTKISHEQLLQKIQGEILRLYGMVPHLVVLVEEDTLPRTASGKLQRNKLKNKYVKNGLKGVTGVIAYLQSDTVDVESGDENSAVRKVIAQIMMCPQENLDGTVSFSQMGISSVMELKLCQKLKQQYPRLEAKDIYEHDSIVQLSAFLRNLETADTKENAEKRREKRKIPVQWEMEESQPFAMSEIQNAYHTGSNPEMAYGGVDCYFAGEFTFRNIDAEKLEIALEKLVAYQPMLRCVKTVDGKQQILEQINLPFLSYERCNSLEEEKQRRLLIQKELKEKTFAIGEPMFEVRLLPLQDGSYRFYLAVDLFICDASGIMVFFRQLRKLYKGEVLEPLTSKYRYYVEKEEAEKHTEAYENDKCYWLNKMTNLPSTPKLPIRSGDNGSSAGRFARRRAVIDAVTWSAFEKKAARHNVSPSMALLGIYVELLKAYGAGDTFGIMATVENRGAEEAQVMGEYTKLMLIDVPKQEKNFHAYVLKLQQQMQRDISHLSYSPMELIRNMRSQGVEGFYPVVFTSVLGENQEDILKQMTWSYSCTPQVFLDFQAVKSQDEVVMSFDAIEDLFLENTLSEMFEALICLVKRAANETDFYEKANFDVRTEKQKEHMEAVNQTQKTWTKPLSLTAFLNSYKEYEKKTAVIFDGKAYSYGQLIKQASLYSRQLMKAEGWKKGARVLVELEKSFEQIAAILGVLLAGGCYVPILNGLGTQRIEKIKERAQCEYHINQPAIEQEPAEPLWECWNRAALGQNEEDLAYIIFTSGSSGEPKGVPISHKQAMNTIYAVNEKFGIGTKDVFIGISAANFDLSVYDIFGCFAVYGTLVLPTEEQRIDPLQLRRLIQEYKVTVYNSVPAIMELLAESMLGRDTAESVEKILLSGDWIPLSLPEKITHCFQNARLYSLGGATEASIWSNYYPVEEVKPEWNSIPYGYPLENQKFYILDEKFRQVPMGVAGRLFIAGAGIAGSYYNDPQRTREAYVTTSWGEPVYSTGDYGRYFADGCIEFLGRKDDQVKINGYRIELGEIEKALKDVGIQKKVTVLSVGDKEADKHLVAFVEGDQEVDKQQLNEKLREILPSYCIPKTYITLEKLPLTANGKYDRKKLISIYESNSKGQKLCQDKVILSAHTEKILTMAEEVFGISGVKTEDSLYDIGVASIDMIRFANRLEAEFGKRPTLQQLMMCRNLEELAAFYEDVKIREEVRITTEEKPYAAYIRQLMVITEEEQRADFAKEEISHRFELSSMPTVALEQTELHNLLKGLYEQSRNYKKEFLYSSREGAYSVQLYLELPEKNSYGIVAGFYYFDSRNRCIRCLEPESKKKKLTLYFLADLEQAYPLYGEEFRADCLIEAGMMCAGLGVTEEEELHMLALTEEEKQQLVEKQELGTRYDVLYAVDINEKIFSRNDYDAGKEITQLKEKGITLFTEDGKLKYRAVSGTVDGTVKARLKEHKEELLQELLHGRDYLPQRYRRFPLTPIQQAYLVGRNEGHALGGVNAHFYIEFETERLDAKRLEEALNLLIRKHDMLRTVVFEDGTQRALEVVPYLEIKIRKIKEEAQRKALREKLKQRTYELGKWPMFHMEISRIPEGRDVIHFSLDCILLDAFSTQKMMGDLFKLYEGKKVIFPRLTFREYMKKAELWAKEKSTKKKAEAYWLEKLQDIPLAPKLPYCKELSEIQHPEFARKRYEFSKEETQTFMQKAKRYHVTENAVVTYCFLDTLAEYCGQKELSLNLTMYSRYPVTEEADTILGDFTNTSILPYQKCESILEAIREVENHMLQSVEHNGCAGIELVKRLGEIRNEEVLMPVVMTSMLQDAEMTNFKEVYSLSCTPQVVLDGQANYRSHQLYLGFDYVPEAFEKSWIEAFFKGLTYKMKQIIEMDDWK